MSTKSTGGRLKAVLFLAVSLGAAGIAVLVIFTVIRDFQQELVEATAPEVLDQAVIANGTLYPGRTISNEDITLVEMPPKYIPDTALRQPIEAVGRVPRERVLSQEFIRQERLANAEAGVGLNAIIPRGMRAVMITLSGGSAVSGFVNPGNYVDVIVTLAKGVDASQTTETETRTLFQAVTVLAVNQSLGGQSTSKGSGQTLITLAVTPEDAERLTHAFSRGRMTLTLRNDIDVTQQETHGARTSALLGGTEGPDQAILVTEWKQQSASRPSDGTLTIIRGDRVTTEKNGRKR